MKKTIAITSALAAASSLATAEIKINEFLSFAGFVDASYTHTDINDDDDGNSSDNSFGIDQVEIDWMFNFGKVTAQVDLQYENNAQGQNDNEVEQAFVSYDRGNGLVITGGRYESGLGLEAKEPTGLYQYSTAYTLSGETTDGEATSILPQYAQGVKATYTSNGNVYYLSVQDQGDGDDDNEDRGRLGGSGDSSWAVELGSSIDLGDGLGWFIGGVIGESEDDEEDYYIINSHLTYQTGDWTIGAELVYGETDADELNNGDLGAANDGSEVLQALLMANYAYNECCSITGRISLVDATYDDDEDYEITKYTLAHNNAITDNLAIITEVSYIDGELDGDDYEELVGAVEVLFTF